MATSREDYVVCTLSAPEGAGEAGAWALWEAGAGGVVEEEDEGGGLLLKAFFPKADWSRIRPGLEALIRRTRVHFPGLSLLEPEELEGSPWQEAWKEFHRPVIVGPLWIGPPWLAGEAGGDLERLIIDPGQAFGTGGHETTRLCLRALVGWARRGIKGPLLDVGTGSGVLALAGLRLGLGPVLALDNDPLALEAARLNARLNGLEEGLDLRDRQLPTLSQDFPCVLANLTGPLLKELAPDLIRVTRPGGRLALSGLLAGERAEVLEAFLPRLELRRMETMGEWAGLVLTRPEPG